MPAALRTPRARWIAEAARMLGESGVDAVRVESVAASLGVTKGGFYTHFSGRDELLDAVLDDWERRSVDDVRERVQALDADAARNIRVAGGLTFAEDLLPVDLAVRNWARSDAAVRERLLRVDGARMDYLREQFSTFVDDPDEVEARSILAFTFAIGRHFLAVRPEDSPAAFDRAGERILR
ncbi:TetR/AcrR family transcriptional regulator [Microbacterium bovistercoris]|uniref:TetR/AcrR family transcriptional regulator n=1 Tax=Microbacterium bovistercoris TaxID=2293570 RepID=A0A371NYX0_9MICO|nr:TetR/AcrR family transcriptional regulator [Microbacterium bovistercoris]REJ08207.1 TetR/AcrR family transcriptional regulator [Microbacterium bovistercoris]